MRRNAGIFRRVSGMQRNRETLEPIVSSSNQSPAIQLTSAFLFCQIAMNSNYRHLQRASIPLQIETLILTPHTQTADFTHRVRHQKPLGEAYTQTRLRHTLILNLKLVVDASRRMDLRAGVNTTVMVILEHLHFHTEPACDAGGNDSAQTAASRPLH